MAAVTIVSDYTVPAGKQFAYVGDAFYIQNAFSDPVLSFHIDGVVTDRGVGVVNGILVGRSDNFHSVVTIGSMGALRVSSDDTAHGFWSDGDAPGFRNNGILDVTASNSAVGVTAYDIYRWGFENNGAIHISSGGKAMGVDLGDSGFFENTGLIEVNGGTGATAVWAHRRDYILADADFHNSGTIRAHSLAGDAVGVNWETATTPGNGWSNEGLIEADVALRVSAYDSYETQFHRFSNYGTMSGAVEFDSGRSLLSNSGLIIGDVNLGAGSDAYQGYLNSVDGGFNGQVKGQVSGGEGDDSLQGSPAFDNFIGNQGNDTLSGGSGGDDWLVGGKDNDLITGNAGNSILYGNMGNDTLTGGDGDELIRGGQDNDIMSGGAGKDWLSGDKGDDTISGGSGADIFHISGGAGLDRVTDFQQAEGDRVQLDAGASYSLRQAGADTIVDLGNGDQMVLQNVQLASLNSGWIFTL
jgi:Ca2+-binding RTX toxin-like protein